MLMFQRGDIVVINTDKVSGLVNKKGEMKGVVGVIGVADEREDTNLPYFVRTPHGLYDYWFSEADLIDATPEQIADAFRKSVGYREDSNDEE